MESPRARVVFLGTGGATSLDRSSAGIAVALPAGDVLLLDTCGGNEVLRQLHRAGLSPAAIRTIVVTHQHFDHAAGLPLLVLQASHGTAPLDVYCPASAVEPLRRVVEITCPAAARRIGDRLRWHGVAATIDRAPESAEGALPCGGELWFFPVAHVVDCIGVVVSHGGRRLVYSGDTGPSESLVHAAAGADVLIHEATGLERDPASAARTRANGHSTAAGAARAAAQAAVKELRLTHVGDASPERSALLVAEARQHFDGPITVAADLDSFAL